MNFKRYTRKCILDVCHNKTVIYIVQLYTIIHKLELGFKKNLYTTVKIRYFLLHYVIHINPPQLNGEI